MDETKICCSETPETPKKPECPNRDSSCIDRHIVSLLSVDKHSLHNLGFGKETAKEILEETVAFYECSCGLIFRITTGNEIANVIKQERKH